MSNEITISLSVQVTKGLFKDSFQPGSIQIDQASTGAHRPIASVGTAYEAIAMGDVSAPRLLYGRNLDDTNYVQYGMSTSAASTSVTVLGKIRAKDPFLIPLSTDVANKLKWKAVGGTVKVDQRILSK